MSDGEDDDDLVLFLVLTVVEGAGVVDRDDGGDHESPSVSV